MYFKCSIRRHPDTGAITGYYRLVESYRNAEDRVCHRTILNVGFMEDTTAEQRQKIQKYLTDKYEQKQAIFEETDSVVKNYVEALWQQIISENRLDLSSLKKRNRMVDIHTIRHSNAREIGSERMCYDAWNRLKISEQLAGQGWTKDQIQLAATQIISRAVYPASEFKTSRWIKENSAVCELTGYDSDKMTKDKLYESALKLYEVRDKLEQHLSNRTNELFDLQDKIVLYDLTNTYFEGRKVNSKLAKHGRSKEKRSDAKLVVLALVVNMEGFIKYSSVYEGNMTDCNTLSDMIDKLAVHTCPKEAVVVLDAGIATNENLELIKKKGYHYLCVSRTKLKDYEMVPNRLSVILETKSKKNVRIKAVQADKHTDFFLEIKSEAKTLKEEAMSSQFESRFENYLQRIAQSIHTKGGVKKADKVWERIGRAKQKYPSVHHYYRIEVTTDPSTGKATDMHWQKDYTLNQKKQSERGIYFLRTDLPIKDEVIVWNVYNTIREIESTFRTLKTDLDIRPIYHKTDKATIAHLHLGLLAYWLVNTIRYQLKGYNIHYRWKELVRIGNTQKVLTTTGQNTFDKVIKIRRCTEPEEKLKQLLNILKLPPRPFRKRKSVVHKQPLKKIENYYPRGLPPG